MKKRVKKWFLILLCILIQLNSVQGAFANEIIDVLTPNTKIMMVKFKDGTNLESLNQFKKTNVKNLYIIKVDSNSINDLYNDPNIEIIEEDFSIAMLNNEIVQDMDNIMYDSVEEKSNIVSEPIGVVLEPKIDEYSISVGTSYAYNQTGDKVPWNISRINADKLHELGLHGKGIKVALFDTGIDINNSELTVSGGISFVDGVTSYDDDNGHGTEMASILAASLNGKELVGVAPGVELYSVKVLDSNGQGSYSNIVQGIEWAIENNINIITLSLGGTHYSQILADIIKKASDNNILVIAAAGNSGDENINYPAYYHEVVCVGATDSENNIAGFSNTGIQMDIFAPGEKIETISLNNKKIFIDGTSAAVQHVAGISALLWGADANLTNGHIKFLIYNNAFFHNDGDDFANGVINGHKAYDNLVSGKYYIEIINSDGTEGIIEGLVDIGGEGVVLPLAAGSNCSQCGCSECYRGSSYYFYKEHNFNYNGHRKMNYCGKAACKATHEYGCVYGTSDYDKLSTCCNCGNHTWPSSPTGWEASHISGLGHKYYLVCTKGCRATKYTGTYKTDYASCCQCVGHNLGSLVKVGTADTCSYKTCTRCGGKQYYPHTFSNWSNGRRSCTICSYTETCIHSSTRVVKVGTSSICNKTVCNLCSDIILIDYSHTLSTWSNSRRTCSDCSYVETCNHTSSYYYRDEHVGSYDEDFKKCNICKSIFLYGTHPCDCHDCSYTTKVYGPHTSTGHEIYMRCSCGDQITQGLKEVNPNCVSCTTAPSVTIRNLSANIILGTSDTDFKLQIDVSDNENDTLTCKYYLNNTLKGTETVVGTNPIKTVTFTEGFDATKLLQGLNIIRVEVKDSIAPAGTATEKFYVDTQAPDISECKAETTYNSAKITVTASDASSPIKYRFTIIGTDEKNWLHSQEYNFTNLTPNTTYTYKVEVKDIKENQYSDTFTFTTKAQTPSVTLEAQNNNSIKVNILDLNPVDTLYKIKVGDKYLSTTGELSDTIVWMTIPSKFILIENLDGNTEYKVIVYARDRQDNEEAESQESIVKTTPLAPSGLTCTNKTNNSISLIWNASAGAYAYDLLRETIVDNSVIDVIQFDNILATSYMDTGLISNQSYKYKLRAKLNSTTYGNWSDSDLIVNTIPNKPEQVSGLNTTLESSNINLSWTAQTGSVGYEVLINNQLNQYTQDSIISIPFTIANEQYTLSVRSFNVCDINNPADTTKWSNEGEWSEPVIIYTSANTPKNIVINNITNEGVQFTWDKNNNPDSVLYKCELYNNENLINESSEINSNAYSFSGLESHTQYTLKIWSINSNKIKSINAAEYVFTTRSIPPDAPGQLRAYAKDRQITLSWDHATRAITYTIKRDNIIIAENITDNKYFDTELLPETIYSYEVIACNNSGTMSASITVKTKGEAPITPTILSHNSSNTSINIVWNEVTDAIGYDIKCDGTIFNTELNTTFEHKGLSSGSEHTYSIRARNIHGNSEWSFPQTFKTIPTAPIIPDGIVLTATHSQVMISWNTVENADSYIISVDDIEIRDITIPEYTYTFDSTVAPESEHIIKIMAVNEGGNSGYTAPLSITLLPFINAPDVIGVVEDSVIKISWSNIENALGYVIETDYSISTTVSAITTSYIDTESSLNQPHTYRVRAFFDGSVGEWSYAVTVKAIPSTPSQIIGNAGQNFVTVKWNKCDWAIVYEVLADGEIIYTGPNTTFTHSSLLDNSTHVYSVRAGNQSGYSEWSSPITVTTQKEITNIPQNIKPSKESQNSVIVTWDSVKDAKGYMIKINCEVPKDIVISMNIIPQTTNTVSVVVPMISIPTIPQATYTVCIAAIFDSDQNILGEWSPEVTFQGPIAISETPIFGNITSTEYSIQLSWNNVINASGYEIEINNDNIIKIYSNTYCDSNIPANTTRNYRIRSFNESGVSNWSESISATTNSALPGVPINITCKSGASVIYSSVIIDWDDVNNATYYEIQDSSGKIYNSSESIITIDLQSGVLYQFQVRAITVIGQTPKGPKLSIGPWSSSVSFITDIFAPSNIVASNTETGDILLKWDASNGATKYEIEMDGITIGVTEETYLVIEQASLYLTHSFRVRALNTIKTSNSTEPLIYNQNIPIQVNIEAGENLSIIMPVSNVKNISKYKMTIIINTDDLGLIDAFGFTPELDITTTFIKDYNMQIIVENVNNLCHISIISNSESTDQIKGVLNVIKLISKNKCTTEIKYFVSIFR